MHSRTFLHGRKAFRETNELTLLVGPSTTAQQLRSLKESPAQVQTITAYIDMNRREPDVSTRVDVRVMCSLGFMVRDAERCCRLNPILQ